MAKKGFFRSSEIASKKIQQNNTAHCKKCKLNLTCSSPQMTPKGKGKLKILHVAQAPGKMEDRKNEQLIGPAGTYYQKTLRSLGVELNDGLKTNANACFPYNDKKPTRTQIKCCHPNLRKTIEEFKPHVIIALGDNALYSLIHNKFDHDWSSITAMRGFIVPDREYQCWICPTFHPSYVMRETTPDIVPKIFKDDLDHAVKMLDVPLPSYINDDEREKITILKHPDDVILYLKKLLYSTEHKFLAAFDYETSGLKPQHSDQFIRTCSISTDPHSAVAFPMFNDSEFLTLFARFLAAYDIKKIAANMAFENNWSNVKLGMSVNGWFFDTMLGAHVLDNRKGITSLEYQSYVNFGVEQYDQHIKKFLKSQEGRGNDLNEINKADLKELLIYNGMDSMLEFRLAISQMERLGLPYKRYYDTNINPKAQELTPQYFIER